MSTDMLGCPGEDLLGVARDFLEKLHNGSITPSQAKRFLRGENPFLVPMDTANQLDRWHTLLADTFGITIDIKSLTIPERRPGFDRLIVVPKGLTMNRIIEVFRTKFAVSLYVEDLDADVTTNDRTNVETYAVWVRDNVEADEELKNLSAEQLAEKKIQGNTLMERLLLELVYFNETGKHLDVQNVTLCNGSRDSGGLVPSVDWYAVLRRLDVGWYVPDLRGDGLRSRAVVS